jgi:hypothetical protein
MHSVPASWYSWIWSPGGFVFSFISANGWVLQHDCWWALLQSQQQRYLSHLIRESQAQRIHDGLIDKWRQPRRQLCTIHNYVCTLVVFFQWRVSTSGETEFKNPTQFLTHSMTLVGVITLSWQRQLTPSPAEDECVVAESEHGNIDSRGRRHETIGHADSRFVSNGRLPKQLT